MKLKIKLVLMVSVITLFASLATVLAASADRSTEPLVEKGTDTVVEGSTSTLVRTDNGISMTIRTVGLPEGAYTIWWQIQEPDGNITLNATGVVVGPTGKGIFAASLQTGPIPEADGSVVLGNGDGTFDTPRTSTVRLILRHHGEVIPDLVDEQISTVNGGCNTICVDLQEVFHTP